MNNILDKIPIRETLRRLTKYILNALIVGFAAHNIFESDKWNVIYIALISSTVFALIDMVLPTIAVSSHQSH